MGYFSIPKNIMFFAGLRWDKSKPVHYFNALLQLHTENIIYACRNDSSQNDGLHQELKGQCGISDPKPSKLAETIGTEGPSELELAEPTNCCMSGCTNCVWLMYAEELTKRFKDGEKSRDMILSKINDPNMKAFLQLELRNLKSP